MTWENDKYVVKWFSEISERTKENVKKPFEEWLKFIEMSPTEQIERRVEDLQSANPQIRSFFESKLIAWKNSLVKELDNKGKRRYTRATIRSKLQRTQSFFSHNNLKLQFGRNQLSVEPSEREKIASEWVLNNVEIRALYDVANVRDRALLLTLYQSGFSPIDTVSLNIEHLNNIYEVEGHFYIDKLREKSNIHQKTCLSLEAIHDIKAMLKARGSPAKGALFVSERGLRLSVRILNLVIKKICAKAYPERLSEFKTKNFRDSYNDGLLQANLTQETKDTLMGHKRRGARENYAISPTTIQQAYQKAFQYLSINGGTQAKKDLEKIQQTIVDLSLTIAEQNKKIREAEEKAKRREIIFTKDILKMLAKKLDTTEEILKKDLSRAKK